MGGNSSNVWKMRRGMVCRTRSRNEREQMMRLTSTRRVFSRGEKEGKRLRSILKSCRDRGERRARDTQTVQDHENILQASGVTHASSPGTREKKDGECKKRERKIAERMNAWVVEVREKKGCVVFTCRRTTCMVVVMVVHFDNSLWSRVGRGEVEYDVSLCHCWGRHVVII